jgi:hypothetical protein
MNKAKQLYELQEVDLEIQRKTEALAQVNSQLGKDDDLVEARAAFDVVKKHLADLEHQQKTLEWETNDLTAKITPVEKKLYGGSVHNPRELTGLQQDLQMLKSQRGEKEDKLLAIMLDVDSVKQEISQKSSEFAAIERDWQANQQSLSQQKADLEAELARLEQKRGLLLEQTDSDCVRLYEEVRRAKQGQGVAKVMQGRCQGCRISLPMSDQQRARAGHELVHCSNCGRILYLS